MKDFSPRKQPRRRRRPEEEAKPVRDPKPPNLTKYVHFLNFFNPLITVVQVETFNFIKFFKMSEKSCQKNYERNFVFGYYIHIRQKN